MAAWRFFQRPLPPPPSTADSALFEPRSSRCRNGRFGAEMRPECEVETDRGWAKGIVSSSQCLSSFNNLWRKNPQTSTALATEQDRSSSVSGSEEDLSKGFMKISTQVVCVALSMGMASCVTRAQERPIQDKHTLVQLKATALLQEFKAAKSFWQQAQAGEKLVALHDREVVPVMLALLKSRNRWERCNAGRVLAGLGDDRGLLAVVAELQDTENRPNTDEEALAQGFPKDKAPARQINQDRYYAAHVLGGIGDKRAVPALIAALQDESIEIEAAGVLAHLGDKRAIAPLLASLEQAQQSQKSASPNTDMRFWAGYGLMWLKHPAGLPAVAQCLGADRHPIQRTYAADALGEFGDKRAVPVLIRSLGDKDVEVRINAIMALGRIGNGAAIPALRVASQSTSQEKGHARISYGSAMPLFQWMTVGEAASRALNRIQTSKPTSTFRQRDF